jgi:hypothetical protein
LNRHAYLCDSALRRGHCCCLLGRQFDSRRADDLDELSASHCCRVSLGSADEAGATVASFLQVRDIGSRLGFSDTTPELLASAPLLRSGVIRGGKHRSQRGETCRSRDGIRAVRGCQYCGVVRLHADQGCSSGIGDGLGKSRGEGVSNLGEC